MSERVALIVLQELMSLLGLAAYLLACDYLLARMQGHPERALVNRAWRWLEELSERRRIWELRRVWEQPGVEGHEGAA